MELGNLAGVIASRSTVYELQSLIEDAYGCNLKYWVTVRWTEKKVIQTRVFASGSGFVFDMLPPGGGLASAIVLESQAGNIYAAMWIVLRELERQFRTVMQPIEPPHVP